MQRQKRLKETGHGYPPDPAASLSILKTMTSTYAVRDQQLMTEARNYFAWQARLVVEPTGRRVVEIRCGVGNFTRLLEGRSVLGLDIEPDCIRHFRARYADCANMQAYGRDWGADN